MKHLRKILLGLGMLMLAALLLVWFLPARWVMPWIEPQLHGLRLQQVHGLLWNGRADQVTSADGRPLGRVHWQLSRRALLRQVQMDLAFDGPQSGFSGAMQKLPDGQIEWRHVVAHADLATLDRHVASPLGQPRGELRLTIEQALLQGGWPLQLQAQAQWHGAVMHTHDGDVALGELQAQVQAPGGVVQAQMHDDGHGPLFVDGQLQLSPLGWRLDATLRARQTDPVLHRWLAGLGQPAADGSVHIQRSGGLAGSLPATPSNKSAKQP